MNELEKINPETYFTELSCLVVGHIVKYQKAVLNVILDKDDYINEPKRFFYTIVHKTICSLEPANILIRNFDSKRNLHPPLFVMLRSILADIIVAEYVILTGKNDIEQAELIHRINFDHIENIIRSCEQTASIVFEWSEAEKQQNIASLKADQKFFNSDGTPKQKALATSPSSLIRKFFSITSDKTNYKLLRRSYDLYDTFSKFEHVGALSFMLTHRGYDDNKQLELWYQVYDSVIIVISALNNYATLWDDIAVKDLNELNRLRIEMQELHPSKINGYKLP